MKTKLKKTNIFIAGHNGMVGSSILKILKKDHSNNLITINKKNLDLTIQSNVNQFFKENKIDQVYLTAGKVGGINANNLYPADFIYQNIMLLTNVINASFHNNVKKLLFFGSSCVYPKYASQPIAEESLLSGPLETTNEPYAIAKIAGLKLCESFNRQFGKSHGIDFRSVMPTNLYGPNDNYHSTNSHVLPSLIKKFHRAKKLKQKTVNLWGTGKPKREFLFVDDLSRACILLMNINKKKYSKKISKYCSHINIGSGYDITIKELSLKVAKTIGYTGKIVFDKSKPDGTPRKLLISDKITSLGWKPKVSLNKGLEITYNDYCKNVLLEKKF